MIRTLAVIACLTSGLALAQMVPGSIAFNARLTDTGGAPVAGSHALTFGLFDQGSGGGAVWTESVSGATFSTDGVTFVELGAVTPLTTSALDGRKLYLEVSVDGTVMSPRLAVVSVPYAIRASLAASALSVGSLTESAIQRRVTGICNAGQAVRSIDASGGVQCENIVAGGGGDITAVTTAAGSGLMGGQTAGDVALSLISCAAGEVLRHNGTTWSCADVSGSAINNGATVQDAGFNISGSGEMGRLVVGGAPSTARLSVKGDGPVSGTGTISTTSVQTPIVNGALTRFLTETRVGDLLGVGGEVRAVTAITNDTTLTLEKPFSAQVVGGTSFTISQPIARFTKAGGGVAGFIDAAGILKVPEVQIDGYSRFYDSRIARYAATCAALAGSTYSQVAAVSPGPAANFLAPGSRLNGTQVCANYVGNNSVTAWTCLNVPYVYDYILTAGGGIGTDIRPTWYGCTGALPDSANNYKWLSPNDTNTVMMACCAK